MEKILNFLSELDRNNHREWFNAHKPVYREARHRFLEVIRDVITRMQLVDPMLANLEAEEAAFRIYRDVRFSRNKDPYKTHFAAFLAKGGRKSGNGGYYIHIHPEESFVGGGMYGPDKETLRAVRQEILFQPEKFRTIIREAEDQGLTMMEKDKLKTGPKDFPKDSPHTDLIKYKHYILSAPLEVDIVRSPDFADRCTERLAPMKPFNDFLNTARDFTGNH